MILASARGAKYRQLSRTVPGSGCRHRALCGSNLGAVTEQDRRRWDERYAHSGPVQAGAVAAPSFLQPHTDLIPTAGQALEVACGQGIGAVWLASRGLDVWGVDISEVAIDQARDLARRTGFRDRCRFDVVDLDEGLPAGPPVNMLLCNKFRDRRLDQAMIERLAPGGLLAICHPQRGRRRTGAVPGRSGRTAFGIRGTRPGGGRGGRRIRVVGGACLMGSEQDPWWHRRNPVR